jgi:hypothetical protein
MAIMANESVTHELALSDEEGEFLRLLRLLKTEGKLSAFLASVPTILRPGTPGEGADHQTQACCVACDATPA